MNYNQFKTMMKILNESNHPEASAIHDYLYKQYFLNKQEYFQISNK